MLNNKPIDTVNTTQHGRNPSNIDDNNFINNTFSFLDDLDSVNEFGSKNGLNKLSEQTWPNQKASMSSNSKAAKMSENENENFPWHAIYPVTGSRIE